MARQRIGARRHQADAYQHNGNADPHGMPTYTVPEDWDLVIQGWPVELITASGGESVRGRQVDAETTHVVFGEYYGGRTITPQMQLQIAGQTYAITAAYDPDGDNREFRVELKVER